MKIQKVLFVTLLCSGWGSVPLSAVNHSNQITQVNIAPKDIRVSGTVLDKEKNWHSCISPWQYNHVIQRLWTL